MPGPSNIILGDDDSGVTIPETQIDENALMEEKKAAKYSRSAEFKRLQKHMEARIKHFQTFLPDGTPITLMDSKERGNRWEIANEVIAELQNVINFYEEAREIVKEVESK